VIIVAGIVGPLLTRDPLIAPNDVDATAQNIAASHPGTNEGTADSVATKRPRFTLRIEA
jgi:hypothetical protein